MIVPDVQGAHTWGRSKEKALEHAREAIGSILELADDDYEAMELKPWVYESGSLVTEDRSEEEGTPDPEPRP